MRLGFGETTQLDFSGLGTVGADLLEPDFWLGITSCLSVIQPELLPGHRAVLQRHLSVRFRLHRGFEGESEKVGLIRSTNQNGVL
jgi:hypothetical protein